MKRARMNLIGLGVLAGNGDGHKRAFAAQLLARLAISDPENRMRHDFAALAAVMKDEKTVTARHTLQSIWRVGLAGKEHRTLVLDALAKRFRECPPEKNASLVRTEGQPDAPHSSKRIS